MYLSVAEENKNKTVSALISIAVFALLLLFFILFQIITPNPPFPLSEGGGGMEINFGTYNEGTGNIESDGIGNATSVVASTESNPPATNNEEVYTSENGEDVKLDKNKPKTTNNVTVIKPVVEKPREKTAAELLAEKFNQNKGKNGGGDGNSGQAGNEGDPNGNPNTNGTGGTGGGDGGGDGPGTGPGKGPGKGRFGFDLKGRAIVNPPTMPKDTKEEGKVVVEIVVDKEGNVIEANPNGRGTTTANAVLKAKARQAALATKFNVSGQFEEQTGTITIVFAFN